MIDLSSFKEDIRNISDRLSDIGYFSLEITVTDECNFRCIYCFEGDECKKTTTLNHIDDIFAAIDKMLVDRWFLTVFKGVRIGFWGGEPTLRPDVLRAFEERFRCDDMVKFHIYTNGYNIESLMEIFKYSKDKIDVQVSYDGQPIHDLKRVTIGEQKTAERVRNNIYRLYNNGFNVRIKSTVTYDTIEYMPDCWDDIKTINYDLGKNIQYSPTVDYIVNGDVVMDKMKIRKSFIELAKKELTFFGEKKYHLFTWFNSTDQVVCNFFKYGMSINTKGDMLYCHGCGYSPLVEDMCFGKISDNDVIEKIKRNNEYFNIPRKSNDCKNCVITQCCMCNVVKYEYSKKEEFLDRWYDLSCQENQCDMFKEFSKVSISLKDILRRE